MQYGKIYIENGQLIFKKHMVDNALPCKDILWAYRRQECRWENENEKYVVKSSIIVITRRRKKYQFDMSETEAVECIDQIKRENELVTIGFPDGSRIPLKSMPNTRDLGAIMTEEGKYILPRKLIRSGELYHISGIDMDILLNEYQLSTVIDFRSETEQESKPDSIPAGIRYLREPVLGAFGNVREQMEEKNMLEVLLDYPGDADEYIKNQYRSMVLEDACSRQYADFFDHLLDQGEGAVLYHGGMGKDRTGIATILLLSALGVSRKDIAADYLKSNMYLQDEAEYMARYIELQREMTESVEHNLYLAYRVKETQMQDIFTVIEEEYGSMESYLRRKMFLTPKALEELRGKYLV